MSKKKMFCSEKNVGNYGSTCKETKSEPKRHSIVNVCGIAVKTKWPVKKSPCLDIVHLCASCM